MRRCTTLFQKRSEILTRNKKHRFRDVKFRENGKKITFDSKDTKDFATGVLT